MKNTKNLVSTAVLIATLAMLSFTSTYSRAQDKTVPTVRAYEMKVPETAKDHSEMAEHYRKVATETREDIGMHKTMLADFLKTVASNPKAGENPYAKKMRLHCGSYIKAAEGLAAEADASARFHTLRAKELEGK